MAVTEIVFVRKVVEKILEIVRVIVLAQTMAAVVVDKTHFAEIIVVMVVRLVLVVLWIVVFVLLFARKTMARAVLLVRQIFLIFRMVI